jgi:hypothetical protein
MNQKRKYTCYLCDVEIHGASCVTGLCPRHYDELYAVFGDIGNQRVAVAAAQAAYAVRAFNLGRNEPRQMEMFQEETE